MDSTTSTSGHRSEASRRFEGTDSAIGRHVRAEWRATLDAYRAQPRLVEEHAAIERATRFGGYGRRQIYELVQNGADALVGSTGRVAVILTAHALYCANEGSPIDLDGLDAILSSHVSRKRGAEIGRFGIGFKSVLAVSQTPHFFSRSGSFGFDALMSERAVRDIVPEAMATPVLRLAFPMDADEEANSDSILAALMKWATTVVRLPFGEGRANWLREDLANFPAQFLLFSPHVSKLVLQDRTTSIDRQISITPSRGLLRLLDGDSREYWAVSSTLHTPSAEARLDGGELANRAEVPIIWAVHVTRRTTRGRFWAFFPTEIETTLSGILNAPWKTNEDRLHLLPGRFNEELVDAAATLVAATLPTLKFPSDPAKLLDLLPARDESHWAAQRLSRAVFDLARSTDCVPDVDGQLREPGELWLHPPGLPKDALEAWTSFRQRPRDWCHSSVDTRDRRLRVERLIGVRRIATVTQWLEALVEDRSPSASAAAIKAAALARPALSGPQLRELERADVVLTSSGILRPASFGSVFLSGGEAPSDQRVHPQVERTAGVSEALRSLGVTAWTRFGQLKRFVSNWNGRESFDWATFWRMARGVDASEVADLVHSHSALKSKILVLTDGNRYRHLPETLLPGPIVPGDGTRDRVVTIDTEAMSSVVDALRMLGATPAPVPHGGSTQEAWFSKYLTSVKAWILDAARRERLIVSNAVTLPDPLPSLAGPLEPLVHLSDEGRALFTAAMLHAQADVDNWTVEADSSTFSVPHPIVWLAKTEGRLPTSMGIRRPAQCVSPALSAWQSYLPVAELPPSLAAALQLPDSLEKLNDEVWNSAVAASLISTDLELAGRFYATAATASREAPPTIRCRVTTGLDAQMPRRVTVVTNQGVVEGLVESGLAVLPVPEDMDVTALVERWGLLPPIEAVEVRVNAVVVREAAPLADEFPALRFRLPDDKLGIELHRCSELTIEAATARGKTVAERDVVLDGNRLYWLDVLGDKALLQWVRDELQATLDESDITDIVAGRSRREKQQRLAAIRRTSSEASKLLLAVGEAALRRRLPAHVVAAADDARATGEQVADLALSVYGPDVLRELQSELEVQGLEPPRHWAGSQPAQRFVRELGLARSFAGSPARPRDPWLEVSGRPVLPDLHDFQIKIAAAIHGLLRQSVERRALLSLPTGAGKTRVVVEALVEALANGELKRPILWIAQTDELCEQAVQTWGYVWRALGPDEPLRISRLWATNEADQLEDGRQVIVATLAKLTASYQESRYQWLARPSVAIIDEAHASISTTYTQILEWLGYDTRHRERDAQPLIGLSATPFRGTSEEETRRLALRYGQMRLDHGALGDDPYRTLQDMRVLARVKHRLIEGSVVSLTDEEHELVRQTNLLPRAAEARLGNDQGRNQTIMDTILSLPSDWPVLLFATSVDHAEVMAAMLSMRGTTAAAVSSRTGPSTRRHFVSEFREGRLRVLSNYAVLTEGFDAPAIRAVFVARPTFSPNVYQQMIGRGLRGPLNGGKEECLILNVADNWERYGLELAFTRFEHLWKQPSN